MTVSSGSLKISAKVSTPCNPVEPTCCNGTIAEIDGPIYFKILGVVRTAYER